MTRFFIITLIGLFPSVALAQYGNYPAMPNQQGLQNQFAPNFYNRASQPLSPYLNLIRGGNPAVNYYYGVRPGTLPNAPTMGGLGAFQSPNGMSQLRSGFLPAAGNPTQEPTPIPLGGTPVKSLPPSGHPISFGTGLSRFAPMTGGTQSQRPGVFSNTPLPPFNRTAKK